MYKLPSLSFLGFPHQPPYPKKKDLEKKTRHFHGSSLVLEPNCPPKRPSVWIQSFVYMRLYLDKSIFKRAPVLELKAQNEVP
jgi:hypothetical protein